jgi:hypothetical protein
MTTEYEHFRDANVRNLHADLQRALEDAGVDYELATQLIVGRAPSVTAERGQGGGRQREGGRGSRRGTGKERGSARRRTGEEPSIDKQENSIPLRRSERQRSQAATGDSRPTKISEGSRFPDEVYKTMLFFLISGITCRTLKLGSFPRMDAAATRVLQGSSFSYSIPKVIPSKTPAI